VPEQLPLPHIPRNLEGEVVTQRQKDGYINATAMCKAAGKQISDYARLSSTTPFLNALSDDTGVSVSELIQIVKDGEPTQVIWVHPQVAINLAQWLSPKFAVYVSKWVLEWNSSGHFAKPISLPYHIRRYVCNQSSVPRGHFSVLNEIILALIAPLEIYGYTLPEKLWPDILQGRMFAKWLRDEKGIDTDSMPIYTHVFEDGRQPVYPKAYPNELLADFRKHFTEVWIPQKAVMYFKKRDKAALQYLPKLLPSP
jgi:hypothetical protein